MLLVTKNVFVGLKKKKNDNNYIYKKNYIVTYQLCSNENFVSLGDF